ncbi:MAG: hypothetical protein WAW07_01665 [Bacteroidales bacterium]
MKQAFAILVGVVMLASGMTVSIDKHYCGGELAETKVSFSGRLSSCGMEDVQNECLNQPSMDNKCCDDQLTFYRISSSYLPEYLKLSYTADFKDIPSAPEPNALFSGPYMDVYRTWELPPGEKLKSAPLLSEICVYRI